MIDLHCHSIYSDGDKTPNELLKKAEKLKLKYFSITDHNNCFEYENMDKNIFSGTLISGVEIVTSYEKNIIEILGYGMEIEAINKWTRESDTNKLDYAYSIYQKLIKIFDKEKILYTKNIDISNLINDEDPTGKVKLFIYNDLLKYDKNRELIEDKILNSYSNFNKNGLNNPNSKLFINECERFPKLQEVVDLIHNSGGLCFLAHIYQYNVKNHMEFLDKIIKEVKLDGVETYHSSFSEKQIEEINQRADELGLYKSGGSDYHGELKPGIELGSKYKIFEELILPWVAKKKDEEKS